MKRCFFAVALISCSWSVLGAIPSHVMVVSSSGYLPFLTAKLAWCSGVEKVDLLIPAMEQQSASNCMFGSGYFMETDGDGYLKDLPVPEKSREAFGEGSCSGRVRLLRGDEEPEAVSMAVEAVDAVVFCGDAPYPPPFGVAEGILNGGTNIKSISAFTRTLNTENYNFICSAARKTANANIWDNNEKERKMWSDFEKRLKSNAGDKPLCLVRGGTLKGGGNGGSGNEGEEYCLEKAFYEEVQRDVVNFNLLHDCATSGSYVMKGDVGVGGGAFQILSANSDKEEVGDTGRKGAAAALVYGLGMDGDWTIRSKEGPSEPSREVWEGLMKGQGTPGYNTKSEGASSLF